MGFPITELMDEGACYAKLVRWLPPDGLACPSVARFGLIAEWHVVIRKPLADCNLWRFSWDSHKKLLG